MLRKLGITFIALAMAVAAQASEGGPSLKHVEFDQHDIDSMQRGAKYFMNYCSGCHSLKYMRYSAMGKGIEVLDENGELDEKLMLKNLVFPDHKIGDLMTNAMPPEDAKDWFGKAPPDLTLAARVRGSDWIYNFLLGFYYDPTAPRNVNNSVFPDVAMPHILQDLEGIKVPVFSESATGSRKLLYTERVRDGRMSEQQYASMVYDLVNFLTYVGEPMKYSRILIGWFAMAFLALFTLLAYLLKKEFWRDVH